MSTLPNALSAGNPEEILRKRSTPSRKGEAGILAIVKELLDASLDAQRRCNAVERLHMLKVTLAPNLVTQVLDTEDATLARYALGLIPYSVLHHEMIEIARESRHSDDAAFQDELEILESVVIGSE